MTPAKPRAAVSAELVAGALGSVGLIAYAGARLGAPIILQVLFAGWVLTPFVLLRAALGWAARKPALITRAVETIAPVVTFISLGIYAAIAFGPARPKTAVFVLVPPASWIVVAAAVGTAMALARPGSRS